MSDSRHATISPAAPTFKTMGGGNQPLRIQLCKVGSTQDREEFGSNQDFDAACDPRLSTDQPGSFEGEHHLMDGWWADAKVALQIGFGWRTAEDVRIGVDECQILTLLGCEAWTSWRRRQVCPRLPSVEDIIQELLFQQYPPKRLLAHRLPMPPTRAGPRVPVYVSAS